MRGLSGDPEWLQTKHAIAVGHGIGDIGDGLRRLTDRDRCDHRIGQRVDRGKSIGILQPDIDARAIA